MLSGSAASADSGLADGTVSRPSRTLCRNALLERAWRGFRVPQGSFVKENSVLTTLRRRLAL